MFPDQRVWWEVTAAEPYTLFQFRWPWLPDDAWVSTVTVKIAPRGPGSQLTLEDGPFDLNRKGLLDAYAECVERWAGALAQLRSVVDFSVDLRVYR